MKTAFYAVLIFVLMYTASLGQITIPEETEPFKPVVATVAIEMPEGAEFDGQWKLSKGVSFLAVDKGVIHIWAGPGEHIVTFNGVWIDFENKKFKFVNEEAPFKIDGTPEPDPDPDPTPDPEPEPGPKQIMFFVASDNLDSMPLGQQTLLTSLNVRKNLEDKGHKFLLVVDDDQIKEGVPSKYAPWINAVIGKELPLVALAPRNGGEITIYDMPDDYRALLELLED